MYQMPEASQVYRKTDIETTYDPAGVAQTTTAHGYKDANPLGLVVPISGICPRRGLIFIARSSKSSGSAGVLVEQ